VAVLGNCWNNRRYAFSGGFVAICGGFLLKFEKYYKIFSGSFKPPQYIFLFQKK
jgi:hypothetical protein